MARKQEEKWDYEGTVAEIEETIAAIESGDLPLEAVFEEFNRAAEKLRLCEDFLKRGRERLELSIELLSKPEEDLEF